MARLPTVGGDNGNWGTILNDYLQVSLKADGTIQSAAIVAAGAVLSVNTVTPDGSGNVTVTASSVGAAPLASPALTGTPTAPTAAANTDTTQLATTAFVQTAATTAQSNAEAASVPIAGGTMAGWLAPDVTTLTDGSGVSINAAEGNVFRWELDGSNHTLGEPASPVDGQLMVIRIIYGGAYTPEFNSIYDFTAVSAPTWTATVGKVDEAGFRYNADANSGNGAWAFIGALLGL
jgi:hypothetical protein